MDKSADEMHLVTLAAQLCSQEPTEETAAWDELQEADERCTGSYPPHGSPLAAASHR